MAVPSQLTGQQVTAVSHILSFDLDQVLSQAAGVPAGATSISREQFAAVVRHTRAELDQTQINDLCLKL